MMCVYSLLVLVLYPVTTRAQEGDDGGEGSKSGYDESICANIEAQICVTLPKYEDKRDQTDARNCNIDCQPGCTEECVAAFLESRRKLQHGNQRLVRYDEPSLNRWGHGNGINNAASVGRVLTPDNETLDWKGGCTEIDRVAFCASFSNNLEGCNANYKEYGCMACPDFKTVSGHADLCRTSLQCKVRVEWGGIELWDKQDGCVSPLGAGVKVNVGGTFLVPVLLSLVFGVLELGNIRL
jgi:hypothetical protein